jgi:DNA polymerase
MTVLTDPQERRDALKDVFLQARSCERCPQLAAARTQVVFGAGNADADLLFVGEAPGQKEDEQGVPFVGAAGKLLSDLLGEVGIERDDVFIANVLKCRPPQNRNPESEEIERCSPWLWRQIELIQPIVVITLGNFATKLLRGDPTGISGLHGRVEDRVLGTRCVRLMPSFHPAAALYQRSNRELIAADFARIPELLALGPPEQPDAVAAEPEPAAEPGPPTFEPTGEDLATARAELAADAEADGLPEPPAGRDADPDAGQLGLF